MSAILDVIVEQKLSAISAGDHLSRVDCVAGELF